jgi:hypothetical protein
MLFTVLFNYILLIIFSKTDFLNSREIFDILSCIFSLRSSSDLYEHHLSFPFIYPNRKKSGVAISGEYTGSGTLLKSYFFFCKKFLKIDISEVLISYNDDGDWMTEYLYPCESQVECHPIEISLTKGKYKFELWGAQGGNVSGSEGGFGGYASGIITFYTSKRLYLFIGAAGFEGAAVGDRGITFNSYNGGGRGFFIKNFCSSGSGGGGTDIRTSYDVTSRIIVAGGGSGASFHPSNKNPNAGGSGGGVSGSDGFNGSIPDVITQGGGGGKIDRGGTAVSEDRKGKLF